MIAHLAITGLARPGKLPTIFALTTCHCFCWVDGCSPAGYPVGPAQQRMSDAGIPGVAGFGSGRAEAFAKPFQTVCDGQASDEF